MRDKELIIISVISKFQLYGAFSYIVKEKIDYSKYNFLFIIRYHKPSNKFRITEQDFSKEIKEIGEFAYIKENKDAYETIKNKLENNNFDKITLINQFSPDYLLLFKLKYLLGSNNIEQVLVDEGLGMYYDSDLWRLELDMQYNRNESKIKKSVLVKVIEKIRYLSKRIIINFMKRIFKNVKMHFLFYKEDNILQLNREVADSYLDYFHSIRDNDMKLDIFDENTILIISDNLGFYFKDKNSEIEEYNKIVTELKKKYPDSNIIIKPHPNELDNISKFSKIENCTVFSNSFSVEELLNNNEINKFSGFCSTALLMSSQIFQLHTISLVDYIDKEKLNEYGMKRISNFKELTRELDNITVQI